MTWRNVLRQAGSWKRSSPRRMRLARAGRFAPWSRFLLERRVAPLRLALHRGCGPLADLAKDIEHRFLACGEALQQQVSLTNRLSEQGRALALLGSQATSGDATILRLGQLTVADADLGEALSGELERLAATLDEYAQRLDQLIRDQQHLERSFAPVRVLQSYFRIESATLPTELQALFQAVTEEMKRLHADVSASFEAQSERLNSTRASVQVAAVQLRARAQSDRQRAHQKREDLQRALTRLQSELSEARSRHEQLDQAIKDLERETDHVAVSLQYQDITRQKIEHVLAAAEGIGSGGGRRRRSTEAQERMLCQVQVVQLDALDAEIEQAATSIGHGLNSLLDRLRSIERDYLSLENIDQFSTRQDAAIGEMSETRGVIRQLSQHALTSLADAIATAHGLADVTTGATNTTRRLAADLHLIGLNAQVQAVRANNGCLEVLSSAVSAMSGEAGRLSVGFEQALTETTSALQSFIAQSDSRRQEMAGSLGTMHEQDESAFNQFQQEQAAAKKLAGEISALLQQVREHAEGLLASADLAVFSQAPIHELRATFAALVSALGEATAGDVAGDAASLAVLHGRYTMQSERDAHASVIATPTIPARPPVAEAALSASTSAGNEFGSNVELF